MRISKVDVKRFLGVKNLSFDTDRSLQLIAGPNNSGKTTFLKAIELFFSGKDHHDPSKFAPKNGYYEDEGNRSKTYVRVAFCDLSKAEQEQFGSLLDAKGRLVVELGINRSGSAEYHFHGGRRDDDVLAKLVANHEVIYIPVTRTFEKGSESIHSDRLGQLVKDILIKSRRGSHAYDLLRKIQSAILDGGFKFEAQF